MFTSHPAEALSTYWKDPEKYTCLVWRYDAGHGSMCARVSLYGDFLDGDVCFLYFTSVLYFEGPTSWSGTNFAIDSHSEMLEVVAKAGFDSEDEEVKASFIKEYTLYKVGFWPTEVRILAHRRVSIERE